MGCDIHAYIEEKTYRTWDSFTGELNLDRDYRMFGALAGVRSGDEPIIEPRGVPDDMSYQLKDDYKEGGGDWHTPSWLSLQEFGAVITLHDMHDEAFQSPLDPGYRAVLAAMQCLHKIGREVRLVFWFDN